MPLNFQSIKLHQPTEEFKESLCKSFNTNLIQLEKDVQELREWLKSQPHLPQCATDTMLRTYLLACKNNMDRAKTKIENYYVTRAEMPDIFAERDPTDEKITIDGELIQLCYLPTLTPDGCRISLQGYKTTEAKNFDPYAYAKRQLMAEDIKMNIDPFVSGVYFIYNGKYLSMGHLLKLTPSLCRKLLHCAQNVLPFRIKGLIFINAPSYIEILLSLLKPFMKGKLIQRMHVHTGGAEVLEKYFPLAILPKNFGGEEDSSDTLHDSWMKCLRDNKDWFLNEGQAKADVNKNKDASQKDEPFEEMKGSFKNLCVD